MSVHTLPIEQAQVNFSQVADLQTALFRLEAYAALVASPEGMAAFSQLDDCQRLALANQHAEALASARELADGLDS